MNHRDVVTAMESKKVGLLADRNDRFRIESAVRSIPDSVSMRSLRKSMDELRREHVEWILRVVERPALLDDAVRVLIEIFTRALALGHTASGLPEFEPTDLEVLSIASLAESEAEYLREFVASQEAMGRGRRASLYGGGVTAAFWRGWLAMLPDTSRIYWRLGLAEHCANCLQLEAENPWTKPGVGAHPLWTVPQNGETQCLANCRCFLEAFIGGQRMRVEPAPDFEVTAIGSVAVSPTMGAGLAASRLYHDRAVLLAWYRRMAAADPNEQAPWAARAGDLWRRIDLSARIAGHALRFTMTDREMLDAVYTAKAKGYRLAKPEDSLDGLVVLVLLADFATQGKVLGQSGSPFSVRLENGETYRQDEIGQAMIFVEKAEP